MKVKVADLVANPFRKIERYPIDDTKVEALKTSIKETTFWDNILARKRNGKIEIAYGHHRLQALRKLGIKQVDIPVRDLDDATMIKIMANENMDSWGLNPVVVNETVLAVKEFLDAELAKHKTWATSNTCIKGLFDSQHAFETTEGMGVGQTTILKFLGGNWKQWQIQVALATLADKDVSREAIEKLSTMRHAQKFQSGVRLAKSQGKPLPKSKQEKLAQRMAKQETSSEDVTAKVLDEAVEHDKTRKSHKPQKKKLPPHIDKVVNDLAGQMGMLYDDLKKVMPYTAYIEHPFVRSELVRQAKGLQRILGGLLQAMEEKDNG